MNCDVNNGSIINGVQQPILCSFHLDKPPGYKVFCEPETINFKKWLNLVLNTITFFLENDDHEEGNYNGEMLTFTLQLMKIWTIKWAFQNLEVIVIALVVDIDLLQKKHVWYNK